MIRFLSVNNLIPEDGKVFSVESFAFGSNFLKTDSEIDLNIREFTVLSNVIRKLSTYLLPLCIMQKWPQLSDSKYKWAY